MAIDFENYDNENHDEHTVARLIFESDPVFNTLVYGKDAVAVIERMLRLGSNYFDSRYTRCAIHEGSVVGVVVGFPISGKAEIDQESGKGFARAMGFFQFLARMPLFVRMDTMMPAVDDEDGYYVHTISVGADFRGRGFGSQMIERVASEHGALYLHVNRDNEGAIRFYERNGFQRLAEGSMVHKGRELSQVLMGRR
ncbi:MAG: GNAT family N-acetyltransferase [Spirochaetota bacterium]